MVIGALATIPSTGVGWADGVFIFKSIFLIPQEKMPLVIVAWTLVLEVFFYFVFGVLIFSPWFGLTIMGLWLCGIIFSAFSIVKQNYFFEFLFNLHNLEFLLGMMTALCVRFRLQFSYLGFLVCAGSTLFLLTGIDEVYSHSLSPDLLIISYAFSSCLIIFGLASGELEGRFKCAKFFTFLGGASYSVYLIHFLALSFFIKVVMWLGFEKWFSLGIVFWILVCLATSVGMLFYLLIERPLLTVLRQRLLPRRVQLIK